ncbi:hypothetical protein BGX26_009848 [Mortierella sp. AD094]|nr:hypothetical protein BGX26_009848 [Mortierella sp. AD094]
MEFVLKYHREPRTEKEREALYGWIRTVAYWLDSFATIGGLHVGLEAIVGFIPVFGRLLGWKRMFANVLIDFVVGLVPWIGDILDVFYKSNEYNLTILTNWLQENRLVDVYRYNREHPLRGGVEPSGRVYPRAGASGIGLGSSR